VTEQSGEKQERRDTLNRAGVNQVLEHERNSGRNPTEMPHTHPGYDVESRNQAGGIERFIEVKSCPGDWDRKGVALTKTQFEKAVDLGGAGQYEDEYVKVPAGWRFASRHVITSAEKKAGLSAHDMIQIRQLAGGPDDFGDVSPAGADGVNRLRSSGVALGVSADGITGRAALKDGSGFYDDVYVKAADGRWRFTSRAFTPQAASAAQAPRPAPATSTLTALDYFEIGQLVSKYARFIDTCSNNGYDYADLFAADGYFAPEQNGTIGRKFQGREQLAAVSGGGTNGCKNVGWIVQGVTHIYVNHIITPSAEGATGTVDMMMIGLDGDPSRIRNEGYYEDAYVKTAQGWRFKSRIHHVPKGGTVGTAQPAPTK
jgi:hypothetical protein